MAGINNHCLLSEVDTLLGYTLIINYGKSRRHDLTNHICWMNAGLMRWKN